MYSCDTESMPPKINQTVHIWFSANNSHICEHGLCAFCFAPSQIKCNCSFFKHPGQLRHINEHTVHGTIQVRVWRTKVLDRHLPLPKEMNWDIPHYAAMIGCLKLSISLRLMSNTKVILHEAKWYRRVKKKSAMGLLKQNDWIDQKMVHSTISLFTDQKQTVLDTVNFMVLLSSPVNKSNSHWFLTRMD